MSLQRRCVILMSALLITSTVVLAAQGPGSDSSAREFEVRYREWRQEMEEAAPNTVMWTSPPDYAGPARDRIATMGLSAVPIAVERADEPWVTSVFEWITRWHSHGERRKPQGEDRLWVFPEFPDISYGPYDPPDVRLILWRWWEEADVLVPRLFAERYRLWKESVAEGSPEQAARRLQRLRELGVWALPLMIEKVREGDGDLIASVSYLTDGALPADATPRECLDWWEANREHWTVPPPPAERITPEEKAFLQEWRAQRPAAGAARVASVCMRRWLTREQVIGYAGPPAAATADGTLEYECTPGLRLALEFGRNGYVVAATFAQADEAAPAAQEPWTDEEREALRRMYGELSLTHMAPVASTCVTRGLTREQVLAALGTGSPRHDGSDGSIGYAGPGTRLTLRFDGADRVRSAQLRQPDHPMPPRGE